jgi:ATP-dependent protease ClpP protease subunit
MSKRKAESNLYNDNEDSYEHNKINCNCMKRFKYDISELLYSDKYDKNIFVAGKRQIHFTADINDETILRFKKLISKIVNENKTKLVKFDPDGKVPDERKDDPPFEITYVVNSPGGSVHAILDFIDYIGTLRKAYANIKFISIITGMVASAGTLMCVIADKRQMTRFAYAMIHELSTSMAYSTFTRLMTHSDLLKDIHKVIVTIYQENRKIDINNIVETKKLEELLLKETWMNAEQYKELGFITEVIGNN